MTNRYGVWVSGVLSFGFLLLILFVERRHALGLGTGDTCPILSSDIITIETYALLSNIFLMFMCIFLYVHVRVWHKYVGARGGGGVRRRCWIPWT